MKNRVSLLRYCVALRVRSCRFSRIRLIPRSFLTAIMKTFASWSRTLSPLRNLLQSAAPLPASLSLHFSLIPKPCSCCRFDELLRVDSRDRALITAPPSRFRPSGCLCLLDRRVHQFMTEGCHLLERRFFTEALYRPRSQR